MYAFLIGDLVVNKSKARSSFFHLASIIPNQMFTHTLHTLVSLQLPSLSHKSLFFSQFYDDVIPVMHTWLLHLVSTEWPFADF